jgi:hypothetical protein
VLNDFDRSHQPVRDSISDPHGQDERTATRTEDSENTHGQVVTCFPILSYPASFDFRLQGSVLVSALVGGTALKSDGPNVLTGTPPEGGATGARAWATSVVNGENPVGAVRPGLKLFKPSELVLRPGWAASQCRMPALPPGQVSTLQPVSRRANIAAARGAGSRGLALRVAPVASDLNFWLLFGDMDTV